MLRLLELSLRMVFGSSELVAQTGGQLPKARKLGNVGQLTAAPSGDSSHRVDLRRHFPPVGPQTMNTHANDEWQMQIVAPYYMSAWVSKERYSQHTADLEGGDSKAQLSNRKLRFLTANRHTGAGVAGYHSTMPVESIGGSVAGVGLLAMVFSLLHIAVVVGCAMAIAEANRRLEAQGRKPEMLSSIMWVLAGLVGGVVTVVIYWAMHFSTLSRSGWVDHK